MRENSILMTHLEEIKKQHDKYAEMFNDHEDERARLEGKIDEMKKQLSQSLGRER